MIRKKVEFDKSGKRDIDSNPSFCMAPFTHTFISPQSERRLCCASREAPQFVRQYIDSNGERTQEEYQPVSLEKHWNSDFQKRVRSQMLRGEIVPECEVCNDRVLNLSTYKAWFTDFLFRDKIEQAFEMTNDDGFTRMKPISFDYRVSNLCNFKCRMCGHQLSSAWELELRKHDAWSAENDAWMRADIDAQIKKFQSEVVQAEFVEAVRSGDVEEIYWVGGEPLVWDLHWQVMNELVQLGHAGKVYCRYNTNLSIIEKNGVDLFRDLLPNVKDYIMCCSIDGSGRIGEWIRTGLNWERWVKNFDRGLENPKLRDKMKMDLTMTLPGLFSLVDLVKFAVERDVEILSKLVFAFTPDKVLSPLALPKAVLDPFLNDLIFELQPLVGSKQKSVIELLLDLKQRSCFSEQFDPTAYEKGLIEGKRWMTTVSEWRADGQKAMTIEQIYAARPEVLNWWNQIKI